MRLQPWLLRLALEDVALAAGPAGGAIERLRVPRVDVSLAVSSIWRRQVVVSVRADGAGPVGRRGRQRIGRLAVPCPRRSTSAPSRRVSASLSTTGARLRVRDAARGIDLEATGAAITAHPASGALDVRLDAERVRVEAAGIREEAARVIGDGRLAADRVDVRRFAWRWHDRPMSVDGHLRDPWRAAPELALRAAGELPVAAVAEAPGPPARPTASPSWRRRSMARSPRRESPVG